MRQTIESAPKDQEAIILEDDASGTFDVAHWSPEAGEWISENGEPSKITPTHWQPLPHDRYLQPSHPSSHAGRARRRFAAFSITAAFIAAALTGLYFRAEVATWVTGNAGQQDIVGAIGGQPVEQATRLASPEPRKTDLFGQQQQTKADHGAQKTPQLKQAVKAAALEAGQFLEKAPRPEILANEAAEARNAIDGSNLQLRTPAAVKSAQSLEQEREKATALALEAIAARPEQPASTEQQRKALQEERARGVALANELAATRREIEANAAILTKARDDAAQFRQTAERTTAELQQERDSAEALSRELAMARREIEANAAQLTTARDDAAQFRQTAERTTAELQQERDWAKALSRAHAMARREIEANAAQLTTARDDAAQFKQTAERTTTEQQKEHDSAEALSRELAMARREIEVNAAQLTKARDDAATFRQTAERTAAEQQKERESGEALSRELAIARREIEANAAQLTKARDDAAKFKQTAEQMTAELQQERDRTKAISREPTTAQRAIDASAAPEPIANSPIAQTTLAAETTASIQAVATQSNPEAARLMARASTLLAQGNVGAARIVLERAAETGSAQASFMLAETYDPAILSVWGTYGTRGEAAKARELYAKAHAGGIEGAKNRLDALSR
jgi:biotin operon repressor